LLYLLYTTFLDDKIPFLNDHLVIVKNEGITLRSSKIPPSSQFTGFCVTPD